jgi:hypothetical protein|tara:strand:+ start:652 stop:828 length:177 start_codon:yes stop_codon:yes gene_type:complete
MKPSRAQVKKVSHKNYKVVLDNHPAVFIQAEDGIEAAYLAMDVASENNWLLKDVVPND